MGTTQTRTVIRTKLLTLQSASAEYGIGVPTLRQLIADGALPSIRPPHLRRVYLDRQTLEAKIASWTEVAS